MYVERRNRGHFKLLRILTFFWLPRRTSTKIPIWYNDVSDQVWNPDSMKEIQTQDCFIKLHLAVGGTVQSP